MSTEVNTVSAVREEHDYITDTDDNIIAEVKPVPVRSSFTRHHTAESQRKAQAICSSLAKNGEGDTANYILRKWFPKKSDAFIARAYAAAKDNGSHIILEMLNYERQQLTKYGNWDSLPAKVRKALS